MAPCHALVVILVFVSLTVTVTIAQQCAPLKGTFREKCLSTGYNKTFPIPYKMNPDAKESLEDFLDRTLHEVENCTVGGIAETIMCSVIYAPHCIEGQSEPQIPCRRVCSEYLHRCIQSNDTNNFQSLWGAYLHGLCTLLPNDTAASGLCYEPPDFDSHFESSSHDLLQGKCYENIFPWCEGLYEHTVIPRDLQLRLYEAYYKKNFTGNPEDDAKFDNNTWIYFYDNFIEKFPKCGKELKMMFCADRVPPCFPGETSALYSVCRPICQATIEKCPEVEDTFLKWYIEQCEIVAYGNSSHGYCKHTKWPNPHDWLYQERYFGIKPTKEPPKAPGIGPGGIAAAVLVPIIVIILVVVGVYLWRNRKLPWKYFGLKADDRRELVT